ARRRIGSFQNEPPNHISLSRPRWTRVSTTSVTLTWTDVPREEGNTATCRSEHTGWRLPCSWTSHPFPARGPQRPTRVGQNQEGATARGRLLLLRRQTNGG